MNPVPPGEAGAEPGGGAGDGAGAGDTAAIVERALTDIGASFVRHSEDAFLVTLPGERKYRTLVWLVVGSHELLVESFVCRRPDESVEEVYRYLLQRNGSLRTVAYSIDAAGDIHLVGRLSLAAVTTDEIDTLLGVVLETSDRDFNPILERGFTNAIRREWAWRTSRGDSVKNLEAFRHLIDGDSD